MKKTRSLMDEKKKKNYVYTNSVHSNIHLHKVYNIMINTDVNVNGPPNINKR